MRSPMVYGLSGVGLVPAITWWSIVDAVAAFGRFCAFIVVSLIAMAIRSGR